MAAKILYRLYRTERDWPLEFLLLYFDDALGARQWVDCEDQDVSLFTQNIVFHELNGANIAISDDANNAHTNLSDSSDDEEVLESRDA